MNKNTLIRTVSLFMAAGVILTAYGCKGSKESGFIKGEIGQPVVQNSTAVIKYTSKNAEGKDEDVTTAVTVYDKFLNTVSTQGSLENTIKDDKEKDKFYNNYENSADKDKLDEIVDNAKNWMSFRYNIYVANSNQKPVAFRMLAVKNTDDIVVKKNLECEYGVDSGRGMTISIEGVYNSAKYKDAEIFKDALAKMDISIQYAYLDKIGDDVIDWDKETTKLMDIEVK